MTYEELVKSFKVQDDLERKIWDKGNDQLHEKVRAALLNIAKNFYDTIDLKNKPPIKDVVLTGSLANYNYSELSDIDLHLIFEFGKLGAHKEVFEKLFLFAKTNWNTKYSITVKGFPVEIYAEDSDNPHYSTGLYSVLNNKWIKFPEKKFPIFDTEDVKTKVKFYVKMYKDLKRKTHKETPELILQQVQIIRDKINRGRKSGLKTGGQFSVENITFKALRRIGLLDKLSDLERELQDKTMSAESSKESSKRVRRLKENRKRNSESR